SRLYRPCKRAVALQLMDCSQPTQPPHRAKSARWGPRRVPGEKPLSRLTPPRPSGGAPNAAAALGCLGRPFAVTRMGHSRNDRYSPLAAADDLRQVALPASRVALNSTI